MVKRTFASTASESKGLAYGSPERGFQAAEDIVPIAEFKAHLSETVRALDNRARPLIVTLNGKAAAVVMSPREYDRLTYRERFVAAINEGLADVEAGRVITDDELRRRVRKRYRTNK